MHRYMLAVWLAVGSAVVVASMCCVKTPPPVAGCRSETCEHDQFGDYNCTCDD